VSRTRVVLADDQEMLRIGFRMVIESQSDIEIVGEAGDGIDLLELLHRVPADVVLMDVRMPRLDGIAATQRISDELDPAPRVLILTTFDLDEYVYAGLRAGASGFLLKDAPPADLLRAIRSIALGDAIVAPNITRRLLDRFAHRLPEATGQEPKEDIAQTVLSTREFDVLLQVARGFSNAEIAAELFLSEATVKTHVAHILMKLGLRDRVQVVVYAYEHGLARPSTTA
jgi:DNA-binding NarL/FixJ family response regulator